MHVVDYAVLTLLIGMWIVVGFATRGRQPTSDEFLLANRELGWLPAGCSLAMALLPVVGVSGSLFLGLSLAGLPSQAYHQGWATLWVVVTIWACVPFVVHGLLPLLHGLRLTSIYEYLELRFDRRVRRLAELSFVVWRVAWLAGMLTLGCRLIVTGMGLPVSSVWFIVGLAGVATAYTSLGGMKSVVGANTVQLIVVGVALAALVGSLWVALEGGAGRLWQVAGSLERLHMVPTAVDGTAAWSSLSLVPALALSLLALFAADQVTLQKLLATKRLRTAQQAFCTAAALLTLAAISLSYLGLGLLAFYHDHPAALRAKWVANVDPVSREALGAGSLAADGPGARPWQWANDRSHLDAGNIETLVAEQRLLKPNSREPITETSSVIDADSAEGVRAEGLLTRYPPQRGLRRGEAVLHARADVELLPWYIATQLPWGLAGLAMGAMLAAVVSSLDAGLLALSTVAGPYLRDRFHPAAAASDVDRAGPAGVLALGLTVMGVAVVMLPADRLLQAMLAVTGVLASPLLGLFLLGAVTRRTTAAGALIGVLCGSGSGGCLVMVATTAGWKSPYFLQQGANWVWPVGAVMTVTAGYVASLRCGARPSTDQLRGLVRGIGRPGQREEEVVPRIEVPRSKRWR